MLHCPRRQRASVGYFYYNDEEHRRAVNKHLTKDKARRIAANFAKLPDYLSAQDLYRGEPRLILTAPSSHRDRACG